jgi:hypothetical protein
VKAATRRERGLHVVVTHKDSGILISSDQALPIGPGLCTIVQDELPSSLIRRSSANRPSR